MATALAAAVPAAVLLPELGRVRRAPVLWDEALGHAETAASAAGTAPPQPAPVSLGPLIASPSTAVHDRLAVAREHANSVSSRLACLQAEAEAETKAKHDAPPCVAAPPPPPPDALPAPSALQARLKDLMSSMDAPEMALDFEPAALPLGAGRSPAAEAVLTWEMLPPLEALPDSPFSRVEQNLRAIHQKLKQQ